MAARPTLPKFLTVPETRKLLRTAASRAATTGTRTAIRDWMLFDLAFGTGLRVKELTQLRVQDLDLGRGVLYVREGKRRPRQVAPVYRPFQVIVRAVLPNRRNGHAVQNREPNPRTVHLEPGLVQHLAAYLRWKAVHGEPTTQDAPLFVSPRTGGPCSTSCFQKAFKRTLHRVGLPIHYGTHSARHTYATFLYLASGHNLLYVKDQLGHTSIKTTEVYAHAVLADPRRVHAALGRLLRGSSDLMHLGTGEGVAP